MSDLYPWQQPIWRQLKLSARQHHALLLRGPRGVGKLRLARTIAKSALCSAPIESGLPCGNCDSCRWFEQGQHPDFFFVEPLESESSTEGAAAQKKTASQIKIDQIRDVLSLTSLTTHQGGRRVILLAPVESLNLNAANALLKTLEEPTEPTLFLLVSHQRGAVLSTIVSRCRPLDIPLPSPAEALQWLREQKIPQPELALALAGGAPLLAIDRASDNARDQRESVLAALRLGERLDPVDHSARLKNLSSGELIDLMQTWSHDLVALKLGQSPLYHLDCGEAQQRVSARARVSDLLALQRKLVDAKRYANHPLNGQLVAEELLLAYRRACAAPA